MSAAEQYIDPSILTQMPKDLRAQIEKHFAVGVKRVDAKIAKMRVHEVEREVLNLEKLHNVVTRKPI